MREIKHLGKEYIDTVLEENHDLLKWCTVILDESRNVDTTLFCLKYILGKNCEYDEFLIIFNYLGMEAWEKIERGITI